MSSYEDQCVKIGVVFHALYFENEVGDPQCFCISDIGNSLSDCSQSMKKICVVEVFRANVLKIDFSLFTVCLVCKWFEPRSDIRSRWSMIGRVSVVLRRTDFGDID